VHCSGAPLLRDPTKCFNPALAANIAHQLQNIGSNVCYFLYSKQVNEYAGLLPDFLFFLARFLPAGTRGFVEA
jgi:hypothetical protein